MINYQWKIELLNVYSSINNMKYQIIVKINLVY